VGSKHHLDILDKFRIYSGHLILQTCELLLQQLLLENLINEVWFFNDQINLFTLSFLGRIFTSDGIFKSIFRNTFNKSIVKFTNRRQKNSRGNRESAPTTSNSVGENHRERALSIDRVDISEIPSTKEESREMNKSGNPTRTPPMLDFVFSKKLRNRKKRQKCKPMRAEASKCVDIK